MLGMKLRSCVSASGGVAQHTRRGSVPQVLPGSGGAVAQRPCRSRLVVKNLYSSATSNPAFTSSSLQESVYSSRRSGETGIMTVDGTVQKSSILLAITAAAAGVQWMQVFSGGVVAMKSALGMAQIYGIIAFVTYMGTTFKPEWSKYTSIIYAVSKGLFLGAFSAFFEFRYPGIAASALMVTFGVFGTLLTLYKNRTIQVTDRFREIVMMMTGGYMVALLLFFVFGLIGQMSGFHVPSPFSGGPLGIVVSLVASGLAASNILIDFDFIKQASMQRLPKWMEWYSAFGLIVSVVWMYTEILRLMSMLFGGGQD